MKIKDKNRENGLSPYYGPQIEHSSQFYPFQSHESINIITSKEQNNCDLSNIINTKPTHTKNETRCYLIINSLLTNQENSS